MPIRDTHNNSEDAQAIADIYNFYIANSVATFEEHAIDANDVLQRLQKVLGAGLPWLIAEQNSRVQGYAYASPWNPRSAYRNTCEISIYVAHQATGQRLGTHLYRELFARLKQKQLHIAIGGVTLPNPASVALHEKFGMKKVAHFEQVGFKHNQWLDVGYWQVALAQIDLTAI